MRIRESFLALSIDPIKFAKDVENNRYNLRNTCAEYYYELVPFTPGCEGTSCDVCWHIAFEKFIVHYKELLVQDKME